MISNNPLLGWQWEPLGQVVTLLIEDLRHGTDFGIQTFARRYGLNPDTSPYLQAIMHSDGQIQLEVSGNLQVNPPLTDEEYATLEFYGWSLPEVDPEAFREQNGNPNFVRYFDSKADPLAIAEFILTTLIGIFQVQQDDYFGFNHSAERVASLKKLGRLKASAGNPAAEIFAMPGRHLSQLVKDGDSVAIKSMRGQGEL